MPRRSFVPGGFATALVMLASSALTLSCGVFGPEDDSPSPGCTDIESNELILVGSDIFSAGQPSATNVSNGYRTYFWTQDLDHLCVAAPEGDNKVQFKVDVTAAKPVALFATGKVYAAVGFQPYSISLDEAQNQLSGTIANIGLRQGSSDGKHGSVSIQLSISFPTQGSDAADVAFAKSFISKVEIDWDFDRLEP